MNRIKPLISSTSRVFINLCVIVLLVVCASLVGVGGAALWIYSRPETATAAKRVSPRLKSEVAANDARVLPRLSPVQASDDVPSQLIPAHYVPTDSEIATFSARPRYTYVSYNGGRQQAHLLVNTVSSETVPPELPTSMTADAAPVRAGDRPPLSDTGSRYIVNAQGRVIGIDGTASAQRTTVAKALPVQAAGMEPEVRVASPVIARKALPVDDEAVTGAPTESAFDVRAELAREDDRPVQRAQSVARTVGNIRPSMFGAGDEFRGFGRN